MKKMVIFLTALAMIAGFSTVSFAAIASSAHDLSDNSLGSGEICIFCHVPHNPIASAAGPLWNHTLTTETFTLYDGTIGVSATGISALCLSCHDGATFVDAFGGNPGTPSVTIGTINAAANVGTDLQDDHPVMMAYPADGTAGFNNASTLSSAEIFTGNVECASCHNPHDQDTFGHFLRATNAGSALCLDCHDK